MKTEYYGAVLLGAVVVMSFLVLFYMILDAEATPPKPIVEVVGTYKDCEIIQYTNKNLARYSYMLYCENQK
jgi:hypothetical protein